MTSCNTNFWKHLKKLVLVLALWLGITWQAIFAQTTPTIKLNMTIDIDPVGNAHINYDLKMPVREYAVLKQNFGDAFHVIRSMESNAGWLNAENIDARFEDQLQSIISECDATGLMRTIAPGQWTFAVGGNDNDNWELIDIHDEQAIFGSVENVPFGILRSYTRVNLPTGSDHVRYDEHTGELCWEYAPELPQGSLSTAEFQLMAQDRIMSSLANIYSTEQSQLFTARHSFSNTGDQCLHEYRVRFRIDGYSSWSPWKRCAVVYPGQQVLDYFYPVLDIDKIASMNGSRHAMVETELEYKTEDGETVRESDGQRIKILSRNEVVYSTRSDDENLNWFEQFDLVPSILTCFTVGTDPVMQQFAGRISSLAGGPASALDSEHAVAYLNTMWLALQANRLAYQTSPGLSIDGHFGQHVKYGRDVLRNRAGTCIDLAVLWASAAESVGLNPHIAVIPGHAFPVIELPNGNLLPIESTMIGNSSFDAAVEQGLATLKQAREDGRIILVDIEDMKSNYGARSLDLPSLDEDVLNQWGYNFDELPTVVDQNVSTDQTIGQDVDSILGDWQVATEWKGNRYEGAQRFEANGQYTYVMIVTYPNGYQERIEEQGTYINHGDYVEFHTNLGDYDQRYVWMDYGMDMEFTDLEAWLPFTRISG